MARPQKNTVDYFPHLVDHGKTIFVLESQYGNDGYAFWFKLLEELGRHENHYFDLRDPSELEYFASRVKTNGEEARTRLDLLARIGAIDAQLWEQKIVWSNRFVENIADAYRKRKSGVPSRPKLLENGEIIIEGGQNPQSKTDETIEKQIKPNQTASGAAEEDFNYFSTLLRAQFEALYRQSVGHEYQKLPSDTQALRTAWQFLQNKSDRVVWIASCLADLFARSEENRPRSLSYCVKKLVEDYDVEHRKRKAQEEMATHSGLVKKMSEFIQDSKIITSLFTKHGATKLQQTYNSLIGGRHAYSYPVFREKFFERLR